MSDKSATDKFIARWSAASASERANSQLFLSELCDLIGVPHPEPSHESGYSFEHPVTQINPDNTKSEGRIDLYRRGCFVLESKQFQAVQAEPTELELAFQESGAAGAEKRKKSAPVRGTDRYDDAMYKARGQAERYLRSLPASEPNPPFLIVADIGDTFEVLADFTQAGKAYLPFPDPRTFRIRLADLAEPDIRERLRLIWMDPFALDPGRRSAAVTREVAGHLAELAKSLEQAGHTAKEVAEFLTRCLFCMFAEDVGLIPKDGFTNLLKDIPSNGEGFVPMLKQLFQEMNTGTGKEISIVLRKKLLCFNGGLFADNTVLPVNGMQLGLLRQAAGQQWKDVEPAIFGTLLERALNPQERHKLGAHYTPRPYVERLVLATLMAPLRAEWDHVRAAALTHARAGKLQEAREEIHQFHRYLCELRVLDPACGTGNFLYVALEHLKRLEGEVLDVAAGFGETMLLELSDRTVDPHQFLGIEVNPRAAAIAELVLWIGYLQWHFRTRGQTMPAEPVLKKFKNIECRDAVLVWDEIKTVSWGMALENPDIPGIPHIVHQEVNAALQKLPSAKIELHSLLEKMNHGWNDPVLVWDRRSTKVDMLTGRQVPDETKQVALLAYINARPAIWPDAHYIVGNPPFIGDKRMREELGDGYAETLRATYPEIPLSADFVLYWWSKAADLTRFARVTRFGLITTNSLRQTFSRRVVQSALSANPPLSIRLAIPDHPWVESTEGAAVRIAMTIGEAGSLQGEVWEITSEISQTDDSVHVDFKKSFGKISADLTIGADASSMKPLKSNAYLNSNGMMLAGSGFLVTEEEATFLGYGRVAKIEEHLRPYRNGKDLTDKPRGLMVIDLYGLNESKARELFPELYQHVLKNVKPERDVNRRAKMKQNWWLFGESRQGFRKGCKDLNRYIATVETSKHRFFQFLDKRILPDHKLNVFTLEDPFFLGVMSSRVHCSFALATGSTLEDRPVYLQSRCFLPFPFPACKQSQKLRIGTIAEEIDKHRKRAQEKPGMSITALYNVMEKSRLGEPLSEKETLIHNRGLVSILKQLHDDLDAAVFEAYGWPSTLTDAEILERLVALNAERAREEAEGLIRWLRPEYQNPGGQVAGTTQALPLTPGKEKKPRKEGRAAARSAKKQPWPQTMAQRVKAVSVVIKAAKEPMTAQDMADRFQRAKPAEVAEILDTLCTMGHAHRGKLKGTYLP